MEPAFKLKVNHSRGNHGEKNPSSISAASRCIRQRAIQSSNIFSDGRRRS
jgi:hypothetical protein